MSNRYSKVDFPFAMNPPTSPKPLNIHLKPLLVKVDHLPLSNQSAKKTASTPNPQLANLPPGICSIHCGNVVVETKTTPFRFLKPTGGQKTEMCHDLKSPQFSEHHTLKWWHFGKKSLHDFGKYCNVSAVPLQPSLLETSIHHDTFLVLPKCRSIFWIQERNLQTQTSFCIFVFNSPTSLWYYKHKFPVEPQAESSHVSKSLQTSGTKVQHETSKMMISKANILSRGSFSGFISYSAKGPWNKSLNFIFPIKYVIPKSLKVSHWLSQILKFRSLIWVWNKIRGPKKSSNVSYTSWSQ